MIKTTYLKTWLIAIIAMSGLQLRAAEAVFDFSDNVWNLPSKQEITEPFTTGNVTITSVSNGSNKTQLNGSEIRFYATNELILTTTNGANITSVILTTSTGSSYAQTVAFSPAEETPADLAWSGNTAELTITNNNNKQVRIKSITVTTSGGEDVVSAPSIYFDEESKTVTLDGGDNTVYFTVNGEAPTTASMVYENPFKLTTTATVQAIAVDKEGKASNVAAKTFELPAVNNWGITEDFAYTNKQILSGDYTWTTTAGFTGKASNGYTGVQIGSSSEKPQNVSVTCGTTIDGIKSVTVSANAGSKGTNATIGLKIGDTELGSQELGDTPTGYTFTNTGGEGLISILLNCDDKAVYIQSITIETGAGVKITMDDLNYKTLYCEKAVVVPEGMQAGVVTGQEGDAVTIDWLYQSGDVVPAETGVLLYAEAGDYELLPADEAGTAPTTNLLKGSLTDVTVAPNSSNRYYKLTTSATGELGFYWGTTDGTALLATAGKAYLELPAGTQASLKLPANPTTGIDNATVRPTADSEAIYTLDGRRTANPGKGIYIRGGKKFIQK